VLAEHVVDEMAFDYLHQQADQFHRQEQAGKGQ